MGRLMGNLRIKLNISGFNEYRNSPEVVAILEEAGNGMAATATGNTRFHEDGGEPFRVTTVHNRTRAVTFVATNNIDGMLAESVDRALTKAVG